MDELTIEGKIYISSKRAAEITGYAKDYVGQLCREGRVEARLVGRSWYVLEPSIRAHRFGDDAAVEPNEASKAPESVVSGWESPTYEAEVVTPIAPLAARKSVNVLDSGFSNQPVTPAEPESIEDMQSAWKEWFNAREVALLETPEIVDKREAEARNEVEEVQEVAELPSQVDPVPFTAVVEEVVPIRRTHVEVARPQPAAPIRTNTVERSPERRSKRRKTSYLALRTAMIAGAMAVALVAFIGTGLLDMYISEEGVGYTLLRFLGGAIFMNK